ncbi:hypothetical protein [Brasilonema bromeliae]|uniref:Uncharacterized protein n=1 Tax=Brasilonema bromeliae SPC951 TaxID=385972 RepID=A0ABX1PB50_9CYAN|nr:hypothetical protein [Brasilonema bromeliae]NMG21606.1 hypothetical protein [Brasilonema bromeliae SPC951]
MATPNPSTSAPSASPSQTATSALSYGDFFLTNLSQSFATINSDNQADTSATADGGTATVYNNAVVETDDTKVLTFATSSASGENRDFFALAETHAIIVGNLFIDAGKTLSFNFTSTLDLETLKNASQQIDNASAIREVSFFLYDTSDIPKEKLPDYLANLLSDPDSIEKKPLVFFSLSGNLNTLSNDNYLTSKKSENVTISSELKDSNFAGTQKFASIFVRGSVKRSFNNQANITLVALRRGQAKVTAPEPSPTLTLRSTKPKLLGVATQGRHQGATSNRFSDRKTMKVTVGK